MIKKTAIFFICLLLNLALTSRVAKADEIAVTVNGNGSGSNSQVQVQSQNSTSVTQNNNATVNNNTNSTANSGNNTASNNAGGADTTVKTGDTQSTTNINNQNINSNTATSGCGCQNSSTDVTVTGNGANSTNLVNTTNSTNTTLNQNNIAKINNNIDVNENTGENTASFNSGTSSITTGNIYASTTVNNKNINNSFYDGPGAVDDNISMKISGNGAGSFNNAIVNDSASVVITNNNTADILNNVEHNLNTGGNKTLGNLGDSAIVTGGIVSNVSINNENINSNFAKVSCECGDGENPPTPPTPPTPPATPPGDGGNSTVQSASGSSSSSGSSGPAAGEVLPATGAPWTFFATLILFFVFLSGLYLRFHPANAPPVA